MASADQPEGPDARPNAHSPINLEAWPSGEELLDDDDYLAATCLAGALKGAQVRLQAWMTDDHDDTDPERTEAVVETRHRLRIYLLDNYQALTAHPFMSRGYRFAEMLMLLLSMATTAERRLAPTAHDNEDRRAPQWAAVRAAGLARTARPISQYSCADVMGSLRQCSLQWLRLPLGRSEDQGARELGAYLEQLDRATALLLCCVHGAERLDLACYRQEAPDGSQGRYVLSHRLLQECTWYWVALWRRQALCSMFPPVPPTHTPPGPGGEESCVGVRAQHCRGPPVDAVRDWMARVLSRIHTEDSYTRFRARYLRMHRRPASAEIYARDQGGLDGRTEPELLEVLRAFRDKHQWKQLASTSNLRGPRLLRYDPQDPERLALFQVQLVAFHFRTTFRVDWERDYLLYNWEADVSQGYWTVRNARLPVITQMLGGRWGLVMPPEFRWMPPHPAPTVGTEGASPPPPIEGDLAPAFAAWLGVVDECFGGRIRINTTTSVDLRPLIAEIRGGGGRVAADEANRRRLFVL